MVVANKNSEKSSISEKILSSLRKHAKFKKTISSSEKVQIQYYTYKTLSEAKKQVVSANHNLKIVLDHLGKQAGKNPKPLDAELNKAIGHSLVFLRSAHNSIKKMGVEYGYKFSHEPMAKDPKKKERCETLLADLVESRKKFK
jgi:predicted TIM-barrel fold metal-dependent hydrolase